MKRSVIAGILLAVSFILMGIGIAMGQPVGVCAKAVRICLECVGIG